MGQFPYDKDMTKIAQELRKNLTPEEKCLCGEEPIVRRWVRPARLCGEHPVSSPRTSPCPHPPEEIPTLFRSVW